MTFSYLIADTGLDVWWFIILCGASFTGSMISASLGLGGGMLVLATMALVLPPVVLIPVHGVIQIGSNLGRAILMFRSIAFSILPALAIGSIIGVTVGIHVLITLPTTVLQLVLAIFIIYITWAPKIQASNPKARTFFGLGIVSSFLTMFVGATGPIIATFISAACKERQSVVATHASAMFFQHSIKIISFGFIGFAFGPYIPLLIAMIGFGFAGTYVGQLILHKLPEKTFRQGLKIVLTLIALKLLYNVMMQYNFIS
jgi:uncharacterized membrane protein YfcA